MLEREAAVVDADSRWNGNLRSKVNGRWFSPSGTLFLTMTVIAEFAIIPYAGTSLLVLAGILVASVVLRRQLPVFKRLGPDLPLISSSMGGLKEWRDATRFGGLAVERGIVAVAMGAAVGVFLLNADGWIMPTWVFVFLCIGAIGVLGLTTWFTIQALLFGRRALASRQRFLGKRMVHVALQELVADQHMVIPDLTLDGEPLDHMVVGPSGVFLLEIQTVMQNRSPFESGDAFQASFDGRSMIFRRRRQNAPLDAVRRKATRMAEWLFDKVGEEVAVKPILVVPGWRLERSGQGMVRVANHLDINEVIRAAAGEEALRENLAVRIESKLKELQEGLEEPETKPRSEEDAGMPPKKWWSMRPKLLHRRPQVS